MGEVLGIHCLEVMVILKVLAMEMVGTYRHKVMEEIHLVLMEKMVVVEGMY